MRLPLVLALAVCLGSTARATILYSTFGASDSYDTSNGYGLSQVPQAAAFTVSSTYQLTSVEVATDADSTSDQFTLLVESGSTEPGTVLDTISGLTFVRAVATSIVTATSVSNPVLFPGTTYWVVLEVSPTSSGNGSWQFNDISATGLEGFIFNDAWDVSTTALPAFRVNGDPFTVPEPGALSLAGIGLAVIGFIRARKLGDGHLFCKSTSRSPENWD